MVNFITDLEDKYSAQVAKLGLTAFVINLKEANERVRMLTLQRTNEKMGVTVGALKAARTSSDEAYRALVKMVNALALVFGEKDYTAFIDYVNTEVTHYKREVIGQKPRLHLLRAAQVHQAVTVLHLALVLLQVVALHRVEVHHQVELAEVLMQSKVIRIFDVASK